MAVIDIKKSYRQISPEELRSAAYSGIVYCGLSDLSDFLEYLFQGMVSQDELDKAVEDAEKSYDKGYADGKENAVEQAIHYLSNI